MTPLLQISPAQPSQASEISALISDLASYMVADSEAQGAQAFLALSSEDSIAALIVHPAFSYDVATFGDAICGVLALKDAKHVYHLFVAEKFHRQGIARALWAHARGKARAANPGAVFTVNASPYAAPIYERLGFTVAGVPTTKNAIQFIPMVFQSKN